MRMRERMIVGREARLLRRKRILVGCERWMGEAGEFILIRVLLLRPVAAKHALRICPQIYIRVGISAHTLMERAASYAKIEASYTKGETRHLYITFRFGEIRDREMVMRKEGLIEASGRLPDT